MKNTRKDKYYLSYRNIHETVMKPAGEIIASGYSFDVIVAIAAAGRSPG